MVAGEGQHILTRRRPIDFAAQPDLVSSPWRSSIAALGTTGFLALVGRSQPGTFLKLAAFFSVVNLSWTTAHIYGRQELNRGVFKLDNIEAKPAQLWERTKRWTIEDATLGGGALGLFTAINPRALPGAYGWKRFVGAATVGMAVGYRIGQPFLVLATPKLVSRLDTMDIMVQRKEYERLLQNEEAKAKLSRIGKLALLFHTHPYLHIMRGPMNFGILFRIQSGEQQGRGQAQQPHHSHGNVQAELEQFTVVQIEFKESELAGPDVANGYRAYKDDLETRDESNLQDWLERLHDMKEKTNMELQYVWQHLAKREHAFYSHTDDDHEKDIFRRELQLLNNLVADLATRSAFLGYHIADAQKRLLSKSQQASTAAVQPYPSNLSDTPSPISSQMPRGPLITGEQVRTHWSRQKKLVRHIEGSLARHEAFPSEEGTPIAETAKQLRRGLEDTKKDVEATERLLRWFEEQAKEEEGKVEAASGETKD